MAQAHEARAERRRELSVLAYGYVCQHAGLENAPWEAIELRGFQNEYTADLVRLALHRETEDL